MNAERPAYQQRDFYGPLELSAMHRRGSDRYMMEYPDDPNKMVRASGEGKYHSAEEMKKLVLYTQTILASLEKHGISTVNPQYFDETSENGEPYLITVVDKVDGAKPFDKLFLKKSLDPDFVAEADGTLVHLFDYIRQIEREGGHIDPEMMHMMQFVYAKSRPSGKRLVLVDVEPIGAYEIDSGMESVAHDMPSPLVETVAQLCIDMIRLAKKSRQPLDSIHSALRVIDALPGNSDETRAAKTALREAVQKGRFDRRIVNLAAGEPIDSNEN